MIWTLGQLFTIELTFSWGLLLLHFLMLFLGIGLVLQHGDFFRRTYCKHMQKVRIMNA